MAIVVFHKKTEKIYLLVGTGYGTYFNKDSSTAFGYLLPYEETGEIPVAAVCDEEGDITWLSTNELKVVKVDGLDITDIFNKINVRDYSSPIKKNEKCPACNSNVLEEDKICPSCGLTLIK